MKAKKPTRPPVQTHMSNHELKSTKLVDFKHDATHDRIAATYDHEFVTLTINGRTHTIAKCKDVWKLLDLIMQRLDPVLHEALGCTMYWDWTAERRDGSTSYIEQTAERIMIAETYPKPPD